MITKEQALKAIRTGCRKAKCELLSYDFTDEAVIITVKNASDDKAQIGKEWYWQKKSEKEIEVRTYRFAEHHVNKTPYHFGGCGESIQS